MNSNPLQGRPEFFRKNNNFVEARKKTASSRDELQLKENWLAKIDGKAKMELGEKKPAQDKAYQKRYSSEDYYGRVKTTSRKTRQIKPLKDHPSILSIYAQPQVFKGKKLHFQSESKDLNKEKPHNKSKSFLIDYLSSKKEPKLAESLNKIDQLKKQELEKLISKKEFKQLKQISFGIRTRQGVLASNPSKPNQDRFLVKRDANSGKQLFIVADGHGMHGHNVSEFIVKSAESYFNEMLENKTKEHGFFQQMCHNIQNELQLSSEINAYASGSTFIGVMLQQNSKLTCANVGDSRAILARQIDNKNWEIIHLSEDHKPHLQKEKKRILKKGGRIHCFQDERGLPIGPKRVWLPKQNMQGLAMSRSLGDNMSKPIGVTHQPQLVQVQIQNNDKFILLASDGVWEFITNLQILQLVVPYYREKKLQQCCEALLNLAYQRWTVEDNSVIDDITFILIFLNLP